MEAPFHAAGVWAEKIRGKTKDNIFLYSRPCVKSYSNWAENKTGIVFLDKRLRVRETRLGK